MSLSLENLPDLQTLATNAGVFLGLVAAAVIGSLTTMKKIKDGILALWPAKAPAPASEPSSTQVVGGLLQEAFGAPMMAEAQRQQTAAIERLADAVCDLTRETLEARHGLERAADRLGDKGERVGDEVRRAHESVGRLIERLNHVG